MCFDENAICQSVHCRKFIISALYSDYFKKETSTTLKEVHLVDNKQTLVTALLNAAKNVLGQDTVKSTDQEEEDVAFPAGHFQGDLKVKAGFLLVFSTFYTL